MKVIGVVLVNDFYYDVFNFFNCVDEFVIGCYKVNGGFESMSYYFMRMDIEFFGNGICFWFMEVL